MRVHELAKELGYENKEFIEKIDKIGVTGKKHLSGLTKEEESTVRNKLTTKNTSGVTATVQTGEREKIVINKDENKSESKTEGTSIIKEKVVFEKKGNNTTNNYRKNQNTYDRPKYNNNNNNPNYNKNNSSYTTTNNNNNFNKTANNATGENKSNQQGNNTNNTTTTYRKEYNNSNNNYRKDNQGNNTSNTTTTYKKEYQGSKPFKSYTNTNNSGNSTYKKDFKKDDNTSGNKPFNRTTNDNKPGNTYNNNNRNFSSNKPGEKPAEKPTMAGQDKAKATTAKNKVKFDKKKYEDEKRKKLEEQRLKGLRTDFKRVDKKKRNKKNKNIKSEVVMLEGDSVGTISVGEEVSIKELAEKLGILTSDVIKKFFLKGKMFTANSILSFEEAEEVAIEYEVLIEKVEIEEISYGEKYHLEIEDKESELELRAPVITIMGHVDHGKTSLLDALRKTQIIDDEAGGITQKIGAYQVNWQGQKITFIDTPGHEAFTEMRARGAKVTDIAVLIVAADDGVKPQTVEAISHAKEAHVPIIVAINKMDKPGADAMRVKQELLEHGLISHEWGGDTEFVEISAKQQLNLDKLLETIILTAELLELKANPKKRVKAVVIESRLDPKMGAVADILIQEGTLKIGDIFVAGEAHGRVRSMLNDKNQKIDKATLSEPVEITGFNNVPEAGDVIYGVKNDKQAKKIVEDFIKNRKENEQNKKKHISLESLSQELEEQQLKELKCIIRADSKGSVEALKESLNKLSTDKVFINIIQASAGAVTEGDVKLAEASNALIIAFNVRPTTPAIKEAEKIGVEIRNYNVIYHLIEDMEKAMKGMLDPEYKEIYYGRMEIKQVFKITNVGNIAGTLVIDGKITKDSKIRVIRDGVIIHDGELASLKRYKDDVKEAVHGQECGIAMKDYNDIKEGDIIESYILEEIER